MKIDDKEESEEKEGKREEKYIYENGEYYIGQCKNGLKHGKGLIYCSNGNIKYDGDYINDKREGIGKFIQVSGEYITLMNGRTI